jgi:3-dehydroquinate synthase class II
MTSDDIADMLSKMTHVHYHVPTDALKYLRGAPMTRVALYVRYSSDQQREASIEDQLRLCRLYAEKQGWTVIPLANLIGLASAGNMGDAVVQCGTFAN